MLAVSPHEQVIQLGFVARNVRDMMDAMTRNLGVGPWFLRESGKFSRQIYRGEPTNLSLAVAMGYRAGSDLQYEIIQQLDNEPSIYRPLPAENGGFHHFGIGTTDFERSVMDYRARGLQSVFEADVPGGRVCYFDVRDRISAMVELIEMSAETAEAFDRYRLASRDWDGAGAVRIRAPNPQG